MTKLEIQARETENFCGGCGGHSGLINKTK